MKLEYKKYSVDSILIFLISINIATAFLQAAAVNFGSIPVTSAAFINILILLLFSSITASNLKIHFVKGVKPAAIYLFFFGIYSCASAVILPIIFEGSAVLVPSEGIDDQYLNPGELSFDRGNIAQLIYLILNVTFVLAALRPEVARYRFIFLKMWLFGGFVGLFFAYYQKISQLYGLPYPGEILFSNKSYASGGQQFLGDYERVNSTFTESSVAGNFLSVFFCYYLYLSLSCSKFSSIVLAFLFLVGILLTSSFTGYFSILASVLVCIIMASKEKLLWKVFISIAVMLSIGLLIFLNQEFFFLTVIDRFSGPSFIHRAYSDEFSISIFFDTSFLGVGLGSNRPSSFLTFLLSNVGLIGFILFSLFFYKILQIKKFPYSKIQEIKAIVSSVIILVLGKIAGVPDLNSPILWTSIVVLMTNMNGTGKQYMVLKTKHILEQ